MVFLNAETDLRCKCADSGLANKEEIWQQGRLDSGLAKSEEVWQQG